jgi:hypothetical protein
LSGDDRLAVMELYARHAWALDTGNTDDLLATYAPGATAYGATGEAAIRTSHQQFLRESAFPGSHHFTSQFRISDVSPDGTRVTCRAYAVRMYEVPGTTNIEPIWLGYYTDTLVKVDGTWRFLVKHAHASEDLYDQVLAPEQPGPGSAQNPNFWARELFDLGAPLT